MHGYGVYTKGCGNVMANTNLSNAKRNKKDEFYTQWSDIEKEMNAYIDYDPDVFRNKTILLPCDDPEWSNFTKYFAQNFVNFGLKKLISTSYAQDNKQLKSPVQLSLFEKKSEKYDENKSHANGKVYTLERKDLTGDGKIDIDDLNFDYLKGDGDFRSDEVIELRNEADFIITNPPFSLFREFLSWIMEGKKKFCIIGNQNSITYKDIFPYIMDNKVWLGTSMNGSNRWFTVSDDYEFDPKAKHRIENGQHQIFVNSVVWFTNIEHGRRHEPLSLMTMNDNLRYSKLKSVREDGYPEYDNYDAIEVPNYKAIPDDYTGVMGVPITFLHHYNPAQFKIVGSDAFDGTPPTKIYKNKSKVVNGEKRKSNTGTMGCVIRKKEFGEGTFFDVGYPVKAVYKRIFIQRIYE